MYLTRRNWGAYIPNYVGLKSIYLIGWYWGGIYTSLMTQGRRRDHHLTRWREEIPLWVKGRSDWVSLFCVWFVWQESFIDLWPGKNNDYQDEYESVETNLCWLLNHGYTDRMLETIKLAGPRRVSHLINRIPTGCHGVISVFIDVTDGIIFSFDAPLRTLRNDRRWFRGTPQRPRLFHTHRLSTGIVSTGNAHCVNVTLNI